MDSPGILKKVELLDPGEVHIWAVRLSGSAESLQQFRSFLCPDEVSRAERFRFEHLCRSFILSRGSLRALLSCYVGCRPEEVTFAYGEYGKPELAGSRALRFNSSHSGDLALFAFATNCDVGVDLEQIRPMPDLQAIASRHFSRPEMSDLESLPPEARLEGFFRCWTRKEAYIKASGEGLSIPLDSFRVTLLPDDPPRIISLAPLAAERAHWSIHNLNVAPGFCAALAHPGELRKIRPEELLTAESLLQRLKTLRLEGGFVA